MAGPIIISHRNPHAVTQILTDMASMDTSKLKTLATVYMQEIVALRKADYPWKTATTVSLIGAPVAFIGALGGLNSDSDGGKIIGSICAIAGILFSLFLFCRLLSWALGTNELPEKEFWHGKCIEILDARAHTDA